MASRSTTRCVHIAPPLWQRQLEIATLVGCLSGCLLLVAGCGASDRGNVTGTVRVNGQPVGPGTISLESTGGGPGAIAQFGADGKYKVYSSGKKEGARVGEYGVSITGGESFGNEIEDPKAKGIIPARYANAATSQLTLKVEPGTKEVDFDLKP